MRRAACLLALLALPGLVAAQGANLGEIGTDTRRALLVEVFLKSDGSTDFVDSYVSSTASGTWIGNPQQIRVDALDATDLVIDSVFEWDPRWLFIESDSPDDSGLTGEQLEVLDEAPGTFSILFDSAISSIRLTDVEAINELITVDVRPVVEAWCYDELQASSAAGLANCTGIEFTDSDVDTLPDSVDNCPTLANVDQADTDGDNIGNRCDADFDNSGFVNFADLAYFKSVFATSDPLADHDGNGFVNFADLAIFKSLFGQPAGGDGS